MAPAKTGGAIPAVLAAALRLVLVDQFLRDAPAVGDLQPLGLCPVPDGLVAPPVRGAGGAAGPAARPPRATRPADTPARLDEWRDFLAQRGRVLPGQVYLVLH